MDKGKYNIIHVTVSDLMNTNRKWGIENVGIAT